MSIKVFHDKEALGGSLVYQAQTEERLVKRFEEKLNKEDVLDVLDTSFYKADNEVGLLAVVRVEDKKKKKKK